MISTLNFDSQAKDNFYRTSVPARWRYV